LCIWWPDFELQLERMRSEALAERPLALAATGNARRIEAACATAAAAGVAPGMMISQAIALCPDLVVCDPDPEFHDSALERLLAALRDWSPVVERSEVRGKVFVGADGLERLYGPPRQQIAGLLDRLARLSSRFALHVAVGHAPGKFGAWVAARAARTAANRAVCVTDNELGSFLTRQPVDVLPVSESMIRRLHRLGIERLEHLAQIPAPALAAQFGAEGPRALAWALGEKIDPVRAECPLRPITVSLDFPAPAGRIEMLHAALDLLIDRALRHPRRRGKSVRGIRLSADLEGGGSWSIRAITREPSSNPRQLGAFLRSRIALDRPQRAVETLRLDLFRFGPASEQPGIFGARACKGPRLFEPAPAIASAARLLRLRLNCAALYQVLELEPGSRLPERRYALMELA